MQKLHNELTEPQTSPLAQAAIGILFLQTFELSLELSLSFTAFCLNHGLGVAATTIPGLLALNPIMFPLIFGTLFIGASTFIYTMYWLEVSRHIRPDRQHYDALKKNLDTDAKDKKWGKAICELGTFSATKKERKEDKEKILKLEATLAATGTDSQKIYPSLSLSSSTSS